jgi:hypothetical protein
MEVALVARLKTEGNIQKRPTVFTFVFFVLRPTAPSAQRKEREREGKGIASHTDSDSRGGGGA